MLHALVAASDTGSCMPHYSSMPTSHPDGIKHESMMIESPRSNHSIVKANARHAILALADCASTWHTLTTTELSFKRPAGAHGWKLEFTSERAMSDKPQYQSQGTPCTRVLVGYRYRAQPKCRLPNQDLHTSNADVHISRIMDLCMHVENPRVGRDIPNHRRRHRNQRHARQSSNIINRIRSPFNQS